MPADVPLGSGYVMLVRTGSNVAQFGISRVVTVAAAGGGACVGISCGVGSCSEPLGICACPQVCFI